MATEALCVTCQKPLVLTLVDSDDDEAAPASSSNPVQQVPDEVRLSCGCRLHWSCLLENTYEVQVCPNCSKDISTSSTEDPSKIHILCILHNEGGIQENYDILPVLSEELYLRAYPEERKCRAFLEFCKEGDLMAIISVLQDDSDDEEDDDLKDADAKEFKRQIDIVRYQDPMGEGECGLHAAIAGQHQEVAWLLLLLASDLPLDQFPPEVLQEGDAMGLSRPDNTGKTDMRTFRDAHGRTAEDLARQLGGVWTTWVNSGLLHA